MKTPAEEVATQYKVMHNYRWLSLRLKFQPENSVIILNALATTKVIHVHLEHTTAVRQNIVLRKRTRLVAESNWYVCIVK